MSDFFRHVVIPALMPVIFFSIASTPVETLGCKTRGILALIVAFSSGIAALVTAYRGAKGRRKGDAHAIWWVISSLIFTIPVVALIVMA
jgi:ABC-type amino acid transport system permease subunit